MKVLHSDLAPAAIGPYSQAIEVNGFIFASGQIPIDPHTGKLNVAPPTIPIGVEGDVTTAYWVGNALLRKEDF